MPMVTAKWEKRDSVMARLMAIAPGVDVELAKVKIEGAQDIATTAAGFAPTETGRYRSSFRADLLKNVRDKAKRNIVAGQTKDPTASAVLANYIWRFLEFGTVHMAAQPHIMPVYRAKRKTIRRKMHLAVNRAVRRAMKGQAALPTPMKEAA